MLKNPSPSSLLEQARTIIPRLERITPDSSWSHRAIGLRRSLLQLLQEEEIPYTILASTLKNSHAILAQAARERLRKRPTSTTKTLKSHSQSGEAEAFPMQEPPR